MLNHNKAKNIFALVDLILAAIVSFQLFLSVLMTLKCKS